MKKYIILLSAALLAIAGCAKFEHETPTARVYVDAPSIEVTEVADSSFTVLITPATGTGYYSYAVMEGKAAVLDSMKLFKCGVSGTMEAKTINYAEKASYSLTVENLVQDSYYTVYAVSSSTQGGVGSVVSKTILTGDSYIPEITDIASKDTVVTITFNEDIFLDEDAVVEVNYYAVNDTDDAFFDEDGIKTPRGAGEAEVIVKGNVATISCSGIPAGAYYTVSYPDGLFYDAVENACEGVESFFYRLYDVEEEEYFEDYFGISGRRATEDFELSIYGDEKGEGVTVVTAMSDPIWIAVPDDYIHFSYNAKATGTIVYETEEEGHSSVDTYEIGYGHPTYGFGWSSYNCALSYPNAGEYYTGRPDPARGSMVTINIPTFLEDVYGNQNAEFVIGPFIYSYGFTLDDVVGTYDYAGTTVFSSKTDEPCTWVIAESDDPDQGNVMFTSIFGFDKVNVYADFDCDCGTLSIVTDAESNYIDTDVYPDGEGGYLAYEYYTWAYYGDVTTFSMTASHTFTGVDDYIGYIYYVYTSDADGNYTEDDYQGYGYNMFYAMPEYVESNSVAKSPKAFNAGVRPAYVPGKSLVKDTPKVSLK